MDSVRCQSDAVPMDESNFPQRYRQTELMYLKWYMAWLTMREKTMLSEAKKPA